MPLNDQMTRINTQQVEKTARPLRGGVRERSYSEETITIDNAITVSGVIAIITLISQDTASLPLIYYGKRGRNRFRAYDSPYYRLMHDAPNPEHSAMQFREFIVSHIIAWGNFYAQVITDDAGVVQQLWPLRPDQMTVERVDGQRIYKYQGSERKPRIFLSDEILHIPGFGFNGLTGMSRISLARNAIGLAMSEEKFGSKFFKNDASVGVVYKHPGELSDGAYEHLKESLEKKTGVDESHKPLILEEGMDLIRLGLPNDDAQYLESRQFQLSEINRILGPVPPHMIGDVTGSTSWGTGIDSQEQGYVNHTLRPYATRIEQGLGLQLLLDKDRQAGFYFEHLFDALLRGDIATRYVAYQTGINNGFLTRNEVRARENLNPRKGLDVLLMPLNMTTISDSSDENGNGDSASAGNALEPLWRDAIARVLKREANDLIGASKRWQAKGKQEDFEAWIDQFYGVDHPAFISKQFQPLLDVQSRLFGNHGERERMDVFISEFLSDRREQARYMSDETLAATIDGYTESATLKFISFVRDCFTAAHDDDIMENDDYG